MIIWLTGLSGAGKTTLAQGFIERLFSQGIGCELVDGDLLRRELSKDLSFSTADRNENVRRAARIALKYAAAGSHSICSMTSPVREVRDEVRALCAEQGISFIEVHVSAPLEVCQKRDPKLLYKKASEGKITNMVGLDFPYEPPLHPELVIPTDQLTQEESVDLLCKELTPLLTIRANQKSKRLLLVVGAMRSGTSLLTKGLEILGVNLGSDLLEPVEINPKGFWEDRNFVELNDRILMELGCSWDIPPLLEPQAEMISKLSPFFLRAVALIQGRFQNGDVVGLKDPRFTILLPFWRKVFDAAGISVSFIVAIRNPLSVAKSIVKGFSLPRLHGLYLWQVYNIRCLIDLEHAPSAIVDYDAFMDDPGRGIKRLAAFLNLPIDPVALGGYVSGYLDTSLRHTRYTDEQLSLDSDCGVGITDIYKGLRAMAADLASPDQKSWERMRVAANQMLLNGGSLVQISEVISSDRNKLKTQLDNYEALRQSLHFVEQSAAAAEQKAEAAEGLLLQMKSSLSWRMTAPLRMLWDFIKRGDMRAAVGKSSVNIPSSEAVEHAGSKANGGDAQSSGASLISGFETR